MTTRYNANGWERWCPACDGLLLDELEFHETGVDVPWWMWLVFVAVMAAPAGLTVILLFYYLPWEVK